MIDVQNMERIMKLLKTKDGSINLINGDCLEVMPKLDIEFDMILCDLPYGTTACKWDVIIPFDDLWLNYLKLIKKDGAVLLFGNEPFSSHLRLSNIGMFKFDFIWKKSNPSNIALADKQPMRYSENISVFYDRQPVFNKQMIERVSDRIRQAHNSGYVFHNSGSEQTGLKYIEVDSKKYDSKLKNPSNILEFNSLRPNAKEFVKHPTQKPVALLECLIKTYTNEGDIVLDNCMGSGSTGVACINTNRRFFGIEKDTQYFDIAKNRIIEALRIRKEQAQ